jgi:hypothetical protein
MNRFANETTDCHQGCQMAYFRTKNPNFGSFLRDLQWKMLVIFLAIWSILWPFGIFCGHLLNVVVMWYIFPRFGMLYKEKSGNLDCHKNLGRRRRC